MQAVSLARELGDPRLLAHALLALEFSAPADRAPRQAIYAEAARLVKGTDPWWRALIQLCHAIAAAQLGEAETARTQTAEAAERFERLDDPLFLAMADQAGMGTFNCWVASRAPSVMAWNLAQVIFASTFAMPAPVPKPQSEPAMTFSWPTSWA
jgi:hypothetical protein